MYREHMLAWIDELEEESDPRLQGVSFLGRLILDDGPIAYCCLGVGCDVANLKATAAVYSGCQVLTFNGEATMPPREFYDWLGFDSPETVRVPWAAVEAVNALRYPDREFVWRLAGPHGDDPCGGDDLDSFKEYVNKACVCERFLHPGITWLNDVTNARGQNMFTFRDIALILRMTYGVWS